MNIKRPAPTPRPMVRKQPPKLKISASIARSRNAAAHDEDDDYYDHPEPNMKLSHAFVVVLVLHVIAVGGVFAFQSIKNSQRPTGISTAATTPTTTPTAAPQTNAAVASSQTAATATAPVAAPSVQPVKPAVDPAPTAQQHEVKSGETLTKIAAIYGVSVAAIQEANGIDDPTKIRIGTLLVIPKSGSIAATAAPVTVPKPAVPATQTVAAKPAPTTVNATTKPAAPTAAASAAPAGTGGIKDSGEVYEVVKGDNPVSIAKKLKVSYNDLLALNKIDDPRKLQIGQKLKVPESR